MRKLFLKFLCALAPLLLCGCLDVTDKLTLDADGSGSIHLEVKTSLPIEMFQSVGGGDDEEGLQSEAAKFPPLKKSAAAKFFPATDFTVTFKESPSENEQTHIVIDAAFKDVNVFLNSPYAESHGLSLKIDGDKLVFQTKSGLESAAQAAVSESYKEMISSLSGKDKDKEANNVKYLFELTLPGNISDSNGAKNAATARWELDGKKIQAKQFAEKLGEPMSASCPAGAVKFSPKTPPRLASDNFRDLQAVTVKSTSTVDAEKIKTAAKFVPYSLRVTRTLDLAGEANGGHESGSVLSGAIVLPADLAPQEWGEIKLDEVKDPKGKSLLPKEDEGSFRSFTSYSERFGGDEDDDEDSGGKKSSKPAEARHAIILNFSAPEWQTSEIARIKATATLQYFAGSQIIKLANAIPEKSVVKMDSRGQNFSFSEDNEKILSDPKLTQLGLKIKLGGVTQQEDSLSLSLDVESKGTAITRLQVYDADGKPFPTTSRKNPSSESTSYFVSVMGKPKPPLSLALVAPDVATKVEIPILLEKVPVRAQAK
jgi:hypothetical protein